MLNARARRFSGSRVARYVIEIPNWTPAKINELLGHRQKATRLKKRDREIVWGYTRQVKIPPQERKRRISLAIILPTSRPGPFPDPDAFFKSLNDALVYAGALVNDSPKWVELAPVQYERAAQWGTRIVLEDI